MSVDRRVYSDEEFALILRRAEALGRPSVTADGVASGLTLADMKSAAEQAGLDPALVERAARLLASESAATPLEKLLGGALEHRVQTHLARGLDATEAARVLSTVRIAAGLAGNRDDGHASAMGVSWHDGGELESLRVTATPEDGGTRVSVALDRRGSLALVAVVSGLASFFVVLFSVFALYPEAPALGAGGLIAGLGGVFAMARGFWASTTRKARDRIQAILDALGADPPSG